MRGRGVRGMQVSEFDKFADEYLSAHERNLTLTGEGPEYFARYKIEELARRYGSSRLSLPATILDFGCGIGSSAPHLKAAFPAARITAVDVSERSLAIAKARFPGVADFRLHDPERLPDLAGFDLIFSSCVFHHIEAAQHVEILRWLKGGLAPGGALAIFEHNPINPVTRYIVATCPFDENAVLIPSGALASRMRSAGFSKVDIAYTGFFPRAVRGLRAMEPWLRWLPAGAQYYAFARA